MMQLGRVYILRRWQFLVVIRRLQCHGAQTSQVHVLWKQSKSVRVNTNVAVVDVVSQQPLKCMKHYRPPHTKVVV